MSPAAIAFGSIAVIALVFAFVGLNATAFDVDELFTISLIDHSGGLGEVFNRALGDTHPPLYYFFLYEWTRFTPLTETMVRLPSALFASASVVIMVIGLRREFSWPALMFAAAVGALSNFFFNHSQYARDYGLAMLGSAGLLVAACALRRGLAAGKPAGAMVAIAVVGLLASLSHSYVLLQTGMTLLFAILFWAKTWRMRIAIAAIGLGILAVNAAYFAALMHATKEDLHDLWFENSWSAVKSMIRGAFFGSVTNGAEFAVLGLLGVVLWRAIRRTPRAVGETPPGAQIARLSGFVVLGTLVSGICISLLIAPSMSHRNLLTSSPFIWALFARLYDKTAGTWRGRTALVGIGILVVLVATNMLTLPGRLLARGEDWRLSARYIEAQPGCATAEIPVVFPYIFGPDNAHFQDMARRYFYGWYLRGGEGVTTWMPAQIGGRAPAPHLMQTFAERAAGAGSPDVCPVLMWGNHDVERIDAIHLAEDLARLPQIAPRRVVIQEINSYRQTVFTWRKKADAWVFLVAPAGDGKSAPDVPQPQLKGLDMREVGDRVVVSLASTSPAPNPQALPVDTFALQRWHAGALVGETAHSVQRFTCDPKVKASERRYWPSLKTPGCSNGPAEDWPNKPPL